MDLEEGNPSEPMGTDHPALSRGTRAEGYSARWPEAKMLHDRLRNTTELDLMVHPRGQ